MRKSSLVVLMLLIMSLSVFAAPTTTITGIDETSAPYTFGNVHYGDYINLSISCTDCIITYYCVDNEGLCVPDIEYDESFRLYSSQYIRAYSTNGPENDSIKTREVLINTPSIVDMYNFSEPPGNITFDYSYIDNEGNAVTEYSYWWVNNTPLPGYENLLVLPSTQYSIGDSIRIEFFIGDGQYNTTPYNYSVVIGDTTSPTIVDYDLISDTTPSLLETLRTIVLDDLSDIKYIEYTFTDPDGIVNQHIEHIHIQRDDNTYASLYKFQKLGEWVFNRIIVEDTAGNQETVVINDIFNVRTALGGGGGGGGSSGGGTIIIEQDLNISEFYLNPSTEDVYMSAGQTRIVEFEVVNTFVNDLTFSALVNPDKIPYDWIDFERNQFLKSLSFDIAKEDGLSSNSKFLKYYIELPEDIQNGVYVGEIAVIGNEKTDIYTVNIHVGTNPIFEFFGTIIINVNGVDITYGTITIIILIGLSILFIINRIRQAQKKSKKRGRNQ